jgi:hypothetical protein
MRPVQAAAVAGSQTSNLISESDVGLAVPCARQNETVEVTVVPDTGPGAVTVADVIVVNNSGVTEVSCAQLKAAWLAPDAAVRPSASAKPMLLPVPCMISPVVGYCAHPSGRRTAT